MPSTSYVSYYSIEHNVPHVHAGTAFAETKKQVWSHYLVEKGESYLSPTKFCDIRDTIQYSARRNDSQLLSGHYKYLSSHSIRTFPSSIPTAPKKLSNNCNVQVRCWLAILVQCISRLLVASARHVTVLQDANAALYRRPQPDRYVRKDGDR